MPRPLFDQPALPTVSAAAAVRLKFFVAATAFLALAFAKPLWDLAQFAWPSDLFSYTLLIPFAAGWLIWMRREDVPPVSKRATIPALLCVTAAGGLLALRFTSHWASTERPVQDQLFLTTLALVCVVVAAAFVTLGANGVRRMAFPLAFLAFMAPFPRAVETALETGLQYGSAEAAHLFFLFSPTPLLRDGLVFHLPGFSMQVAPECSGIHSSVVLFITSLFAGAIFLRSPWRRTALALAVIPLAFLRNGFRVFVIGELCVHVSPDMIHSAIHRRGGPVFFALSLIPLFALLYLLHRSEARKASLPPIDTAQANATVN